MWFLFHRKARTAVVRGGKTMVHECPTCERTTRFAEVEVTKKYGVWFVDVLDDKERAYRCTECGDTFDLVEAAPQPAASSTGWARTEQLAAEQRRRDAFAASQRAAIETRLDDELAALKKKMGR
jgi:hypothetical protein